MVDEIANAVVSEPRMFSQRFYESISENQQATNQQSSERQLQKLIQEH